MIIGEGFIKMKKWHKFKFERSLIAINEDEKPNIEKHGKFIDIEIMKPSIWITLDTKNMTYRYSELNG